MMIRVSGYVDEEGEWREDIMDTYVLAVPPSFSPLLEVCYPSSSASLPLRSQQLLNKMIDEQASTQSNMDMHIHI